MENTVKFYLGLPQFKICNCSPACFWDLIFLIVHVSFLGRSLWYNTTRLFFLVLSILHIWSGKLEETHSSLLGWSQKMHAGGSCTHELCGCSLQTALLLLWTTWDYMRFIPGWQTAGCALPWDVAEKALGCCKQDLLQDQEREMQ